MPDTVPATPPSPALPRGECRVWPRHRCEMFGSCQPLAARLDKDVSWPGQVRDISQGGVALLLKRRFECGTALVLELTSPATGEAQSFLLRVANVRPMEGGQYVLGCSFLSRLSQEKLRRLLGDEPPEGPPAAAAEAQPLVYDVIFQGRLPTFRARRFHHRSPWPLAAGTALTLGFGGPPEAPVRLKIRVTSCSPNGERWVVRYEVAETPSPEVLRRLHRTRS